MTTRLGIGGLRTVRPRLSAAVCSSSSQVRPLTVCSSCWFTITPATVSDELVSALRVFEQQRDAAGELVGGAPSDPWIRFARRGDAPW